MGIVVGAVALLVIVIIVVLFLKKRKNKKQPPNELDMIPARATVTKLGNVQVLEQLGGGNFSDVFKGKWEVVICINLR